MLCPWGGGVFDLSEAVFVAGAITRCSAGCQLCRSGDCSSLGMPRSCNEGLELWGRVPTYPEGSEIRVRRSSCVCCTCDLHIIISGRLGDPLRVFALVMQMGSRFRRPKCEASGVPVGLAWAYRDVLKGAQAVLSVVRRACELGTLLIRVVPNCLDCIFSCPLCLRKGVPHRWTPPSSKYKERVQDKFSGKRELAHRSSPVVNASAAILGKARGAGSHEDRRVKQRRVGRDHSPVGDVIVLVTFAAGGQGHALFVGVVAYDLLWREGWDLVSKFQGVGWEAFIVLIVVVQGTMLSMDGGSRLKGVKSLKSSEDLWGPVRWHSLLDSFPYSEPLTNIASYFGARGISDEGTNARSLRNAAWEYPPSRGRATDAREKESPLTVYDP
ncbi:hypothetical protein CRG98_021446 [Punica granatum]|uniref:Uncharacterized protein n=1 Tax=Punica granatum TaxID=22663 RepID=A0A2I0JPC6_PUNGR|nr:hypothetical protein CRG98_021446 [Punica granatum]